MSQKIEKSFQPVKFQLIFLGISGFLLAVFASRLTRAFDEFATDLDLSGLAKISWLIVVLITALLMLILWLKSRGNVYEITTDSIIVGGNGLGGASNRKVYSASHITSVSAKQTWLGRKYNYGQIVINMDRLENNQSVRLIDVQNPAEVADKISTLIK